MKKSTQTTVAISSGAFFLAAFLVIAFACPNPTEFQYTVFRIILAVGAAAFATVIPGILEISVSNWLKAGGALAVFVIIYFYSPAQLAVGVAQEVNGVPASILPDARSDYAIKLMQYERGLGKGSMSELVAAHRQLAAAEVAAARGAGDRRVAREAAVERATGLYKMVETRVGAGMGNESDVLEARQCLKQAEFDLANGH